MLTYQRIFSISFLVVSVDWSFLPGYIDQSRKFISLYIMGTTMSKEYKIDFIPTLNYMEQKRPYHICTLIVMYDPSYSQCTLSVQRNLAVSINDIIGSTEHHLKYNVNQPCNWIIWRAQTQPCPLRPILNRHKLDICL